MDVSRLRVLMKIKKINQKEIAEALEMSSNAVSAFLRKGDFKVSQLEKIAEVLQIPIAILFEKDIDLNIVKDPIHIYYVKNGTSVQNHNTKIDKQDNSVKNVNQKYKELLDKYTLLQKIVNDKEMFMEELITSKNSEIELLRDKIKYLENKL